MRVAVFVAKRPEAVADDDSTAYIVVSASSPRADVLKAVARGGFDAFVNACPSSEAGAANARTVAEALSAANVAWAGVRPKFLTYNRAQVKMAMHYEGASVAPHRVVTADMSVDAAVDGLEFPVVLRSDENGDSATRSEASSREELDAVVAQWRLEHPRFVIEQRTFGDGETTVVRIAGNGRSAAVMHEGGAAAELVAHALHLFKAVYENNGMCAFVFRPSKAAAGGDAIVKRYVLDDVLPEATPEWAALKPFVDVAAAAAVKPMLPTYSVTFHPQMRGYHVRAARDLAKGEIVFADEGHAFPVVTRPHVASTWSEADRDVFSRYAWPLDSDAHVYAIWENDPRTWRPINHSCDPNLFFGDNHSLNVVAARDIRAGDDLTLDYTTFCDGTMQAFDCFCGAAECRKRIFPDEANLRRFGTNAWHRRLPNAPTLLGQQ